ncbi:phosphate ABC transporter substrate-binding/OmpA family protein [Pseudaestuariivita rosea]|uniref:phosphate ABC transporter substrate-binding/OmpA family protein n=1 Tax=Pseudaestuariivita rosea TaxID=2763263 RepID=UPI001ABAD91F|nr:phosphate ABC transporter substrate-binding/OmpA family protein [Pseudaestuariivita rosea]
MVNKHRTSTSLSTFGLGVALIFSAAGFAKAQDTLNPQTFRADVTIAGSDTIGENIMPFLFSGYAESLGAAATVVEVDKDDVTTPSGEDEMLVEIIGNDGFGDPVANVRVIQSGSSDGLESLLNRDVEISMATRRIRDEEVAEFAAVGARDMRDFRQEHVVAIDTVVLIVNPENPVDEIALQDLAAIYKGEITNWSQVGGPNAPINAYTRQEGSGTARSIYRTIAPNDEDFKPAANINVADGTSEMIESIRNDPNALGFASYSRKRDTKPLSLISFCGITVSPEPFTAKAEEYLFQRRFHLYTRPDTLSDKGQAIIDFALSPGADDVITKSGYINLGIEARDQSESTERMRDVLRSTDNPAELTLMRDIMVDMFDWDRLSSTFRFAYGSANLEGKALRDLDRLIQYLNDSPDISEIAVVGFTDSDGSFESNRVLSIARAERVAQALRQTAGDALRNVDVVTKGYGELSPAVCNNTSDEKALNRRVEIWVRK